MISNGRSQLLKSNSTSGLDKLEQNVNGQNVQGNIIHIAVNNYTESKNKTTAISKGDSKPYKGNLKM